MPKRSVKETPYDPIKADLAREVGSTGRHSVVSMPTHSIQPAATLSPPMPSRETAYPARGLNSGYAEPFRPPSVSATAAAVGTTLVTKRFVISRTEEAEVGAFLIRLQQQSAARLSLSMLVRALVTLAMQAEEKIAAELAQYQFRSPSTLDRLAMSEFEDLWQRCLEKALKRPDPPTWPAATPSPYVRPSRTGL